jgi:hypothetical protein
MRRITPGEGSTIQLTDEDYLATVRPLTPTDERTVDRPLTRPRPLDERTLIDELCRVSHFGWIPEAVIRCALTLARGREIPTDSLHQWAARRHRSTTLDNVLYNHLQRKSPASDWVLRTWATSHYVYARRCDHWAIAVRCMTGGCVVLDMRLRFEHRRPIERVKTW